MTGNDPEKMHIISTTRPAEWFYRFCNAFGLMRDRVYPLEYCLITKLFEILPDHYRSVFEQQFACYNRFERSGWGWTELQMRRKYRGKIHFPEELRVPTEKDDIRLASIKFGIPGGVERFNLPYGVTEFNVVFHVFNGRLFDLSFGEDYRPIRFCDEIDVIRYKVNRTDFPSLESD